MAERKTMSTFNRTTLVKVLEILDSSHAGEALAAAKLASTMVREAGLTWDDVLAPAIQGRGAAPPAIATQATSAGPFNVLQISWLSDADRATAQAQIGQMPH